MTPVSVSPRAPLRLPIPERETIHAALAALSPRDRRLYWFAVVLQVLLSLLDLFGVLLLGVVGALLAAAASDSALPTPVARLLETLGIPTDSLVDSALSLAAAAAVILVVESAAALLIHTRLMRFLGRRAGSVGAELGARFLHLPLLEVRRHPSQKTAFALIEGVTDLITRTLGNLLVIIGEVALLAVLGVALLLVDPLTTVVAIVYFGAVTWLLNRRLGQLASRAGSEAAESNIAARTVTQDAVDTYPEISVMNRRGFFAERFAGERQRYASAQASSMVIAAVPRYGMEAALVVGAALMAVTLALTNDTAGAVGGLVLFLAAASRVVPSLLRLNSALIGMRNQAAAATRAAELAVQIRTAEQAQGIQATDTAAASATVAASSASDAYAAADLHAAAQAASPGAATVDIRHVHLTYPGRDRPALVDVSLAVPHGCSLALAGPTGAGKSSLVAVLLGLVAPTSGSVRVGGLDPRGLLRATPSVLGYVPQDVALVSGSIRENVALGLPAERIDDRAVWDALQRAHLDAFVESLPTGLDTAIGERGLRLSGGQRQRLGLARALYDPPQLLVLDEATSALDAETERAITDTITSLAGQITTVTVAHRLATIRDADIVAYLEGGRLVAHGSFGEVRTAVPGFERQAQLLGL